MSSTQSGTASEIDGPAETCSRNCRQISHVRSYQLTCYRTQLVTNGSVFNRRTHHTESARRQHQVGEAAGHHQAAVVGGIVKGNHVNAVILAIHVCQSPLTVASKHEVAYVPAFFHEPRNCANTFWTIA